MCFSSSIEILREAERLEAELNQLQAQRESATVTSTSLPRINARVAEIKNRLIYLAALTMGHAVLSLF